MTKSIISLFIGISILSLFAVSSISLADIKIQGHQGLIDISNINIKKKQKELGTNVENLFMYVRDQIHFEAYKGVLRGATGTMLSCAGNSADKAILLHDLLVEANHEARFVHGILDSSSLDQIWKSMLVPYPSRTHSPEAGEDSEVKAFMESLHAEIKSQYTTIIKAIENKEPQIPVNSTFNKNDAKKILTDHYWVQYRKDGQWIDLDPSLPNAMIGLTYAQKMEILAKLPNDLFHRVVIRVILEQVEGGGSKELTLMTYEANTAELSGKSLMLVHQRGSWGGPTPMLNLDALAAPPDNAKPILVVDEEYKVGETFNIQSPQKKTGWFALTSGDKPVTAISERIEFAFHSPDGKVDKTERFIFDRIGFAARKKGVKTFSKEVLGMEHPLWTLMCLSFYTGPLKGDIRSKDSGEKKESTLASSENLTFGDIGVILKTINHTVSIISDHLVHPLKVGNGSVMYSMTSPRLILTTLQESPKEANISIDLHHSRYQSITTSPSLTMKDFQLQILRGVVDGIVESKVLDLILSDKTAEGVKPKHYSLDIIFRESTRNGKRLKFLSRGRDEKIPELPPDAEARIEADLKEDNFVIVPESIPASVGHKHVAWWRINQKTGETMAVAEDGLHRALGEYVLITYQRTGLADFGRYGTLGAGGGVTWLNRNVPWARLDGIIHAIISGKNHLYWTHHW